MTKKKPTESLQNTPKGLTGVTTLELEQLMLLQKGVIKKYAKETNHSIEDVNSQFNSNFKNDYYQTFLNHLKTKKYDLGISQANPKPLSEIFYFTKEVRTSGRGSFRKQLINSLFQYAFDKDISEILITKETSLINKLSGYWECYYDKDESFKSTMQDPEIQSGSLSRIAFTIKGETVNSAIIKYYQNKNWGTGELKVFGQNFILKLESEKNKEPTFQVMNCGFNIDEATEHIKDAAGVFLHINEKKSPKFGKCLMLYFDEEKLQSKFSLKDVDLFSGVFMDKFESTLNIESDTKDKTLKRIKSFFERGHNTSDVHLNDFNAID